MSKQLLSLSWLVYPVIEGLILGIACLLTPNALANPTFPLVNKDGENFSARSLSDNSSCTNFIPINNTLKPNVTSSETQSTENFIVPTSTCAADLMGVSSASEFAQTATETFITQDNAPVTPPSNSEEISQAESQDVLPKADPQADRWHFKFQPYVTIPVSTYGSATVKGRKVNYSLSLGELLQSLRVTASGRVEAWKGRFGLILDGYYVSLRGISSSQSSRSRTPGSLNALDYLFSKSINRNLQELTTSIDREIQAARDNEQLKKNQIFQDLDRQVEDFKLIVAQDAQDLQDLELKVKDFKESLARDGQELKVLELKVENLQELDLNTQGFADILSLNVQDLPRTEDLEELNAKIQQLGKLPDTGRLEHELNQTREILEEGSHKVKELREERDSEKLQKLDAQIQEAKALVDREIQRISEIQDFQENRLPQELNTNSSTDLQFDQGIYDFAVSYHIGDLPQHELPDRPSNRPFPLIWFEPIVGVRLNNLDIEIDNTIDVELSSSLVNFQGTFQNTYSQGRTWLEPMLGGKFGVQVSDPIVLWVRGDVSGFGLAGETDLSWNFLFGLDWWVRRNLSLQLAYRFYEINYQNGSGDNAFGFQENFNGPYLSATFHF